LIPNADRSAGVDVGASLAKLVLREPAGLGFRCFPSQNIERAVLEVEQFEPDRVAVTGAGAARFSNLLGFDTTQLTEFDAWSAGAAALLARQGLPAPEKDLVVSLGTGTSMLLVEATGGARLAGTALGGGTLLGLGRQLLDCGEHAALMTLAGQGDRRRVDLCVSDLDPEGHLPLPGHITASAFGKLTREDVQPEPADLAHALVGLVAENVGVLARLVAAVSQARRIVYGGSTLREPSVLQPILVDCAPGSEVIFLEQGEYAGALGALELLAR